MKRVFKHLDQEKRRLYSIAFLAFSAGYVLYAHIDATRMGLPLPVLTGLIYMGAIVIATAFTSYFLPGLTRVTDAVAVTRLGFALWIASTHSHDLAASPVLGATIVVGGAMVLLQLCTWSQLAAQKLPQALPHFFMLGMAQQRLAVQTVRAV